MFNITSISKTKQKLKFLILISSLYSLWNSFFLGKIWMWLKWKPLPWFFALLSGFPIARMMEMQLQITSELRTHNQHLLAPTCPEPRVHCSVMVSTRWLDSGKVWETKLPTPSLWKNCSSSLIYRMQILEFSSKYNVLNMRSGLFNLLPLNKTVDKSNVFAKKFIMQVANVRIMIKSDWMRDLREADKGHWSLLRPASRS